MVRSALLSTKEGTLQKITNREAPALNIPFLKAKAFDNRSKERENSKVKKQKTSKLQKGLKMSEARGRFKVQLGIS